LINVSDPGGTIEYELRPDGQPASVTVNDTICTTFLYDSYGRRTDLYDPSAGHRSYQYDTSGNVSRVTDGRGKWVGTTYNSIGLPTEQSTSDGLVTTITYDNLSRMTGMSDNAGHSHTWSYDSNLRLSEENLDGFKKSFAYSGNNI
jgi:YD repeat-containing protein